LAKGKKGRKKGGAFSLRKRAGLLGKSTPRRSGGGQRNGNLWVEILSRQKNLGALPHTKNEKDGAQPVREGAGSGFPFFLPKKRIQ